MSRIGNKLITLAEGVTVDVQADNFVTVKGPKGEISAQLCKEMTIEVEGARHEFSALPGVQEDLTSIILNLKDLVLDIDDGDNVSKKCTIEVEGPAVVTGAVSGLSSSAINVLLYFSANSWAVEPV